MVELHVPSAGAITSLGPTRHDVQRAATDSWKSLGLEVFSLNAADDIPALAERYPGVTFIPAPRVREVAPGRVMVHVYDAIQAVQAKCFDTFVVVNSDIELAATTRFPVDLKRWSRGGLVVGARADVERSGERYGPVLPHGFDYFFFDERVAASVVDLGFCFGLPWWDYAVPFWALARGIPVHRLSRPVGFHVKHATAWGWEPWLTLGRRFVRQIRGMHDVAPEVAHIAAMARETPWKMQEIGQEIVRVILYRCPTVDPGSVM